MGFFWYVSIFNIYYFLPLVPEPNALDLALILGAVYQHGDRYWCLWRPSQHIALGDLCRINELKGVDNEFCLIVLLLIIYILANRIVITFLVVDHFCVTGSIMDFT